MMLATGYHIGECLAIGWSEVDLAQGSVDIAWRLVRRKGQGLLRLHLRRQAARENAWCLCRHGLWTCSRYVVQHCRAGSSPSSRTLSGVGAIRTTSGACG